MSQTSPDNGEPVTGRAWAVVIVGLVVMGMVVYLGWASSYLSARLIVGQKAGLIVASPTPDAP